MELPSRDATDRFVEPGVFRSRSQSIADRPGVNEIPTLIVSAFDHRTRMLPFILWDQQIVPAGARAVSAALSGMGFVNQRLVNQAWTPLVKPSRSRIAGRPIELLCVSSMQIHSAPAYALIRDAHAMGEDRPLIVAGGPKAIYQPWDYFGDSPNTAPDVVCTGEEFVLLELIDRLTESKRANETIRSAFDRARARGWLDDIPGLLYDRGEPGAPELVDTGVQRLLRDFDELPSPVEGYRYLEAPHRRRLLDKEPLPLSKVRRHTRVASLLTTRGCKFRCGYCPIPAYNQFSFRSKSPEGLVRDIAALRRQLGIHLFFGTDDNFFNDESIVVDTFEALARAGFEKDDIGKAARFGTEATEFDVHKQRHLLPLAYRGGLRAVWFGIEDMTAELIKKGQSVEKTKELFAEMRRQRIIPMAMLMHFDGQPLSTPGSMLGLLQQVKFLYGVGAGTVQVTVLGPAAGTKDYDPVLKSGIILKTLAGQGVPDRYWDGNHVISVGNDQPWKLQRNLLVAYATFYNPINLLRAPFRKGWKWSDLFLQVWGMWGLAHTAWRLVPWLFRLTKVKQGRYTVYHDVPRSKHPIVPPDGIRDDAKSGYVRQTTGSDGRDERDDRVEPGRRASLAKY